MESTSDNATDADAEKNENGKKVTSKPESTTDSHIKLEDISPWPIYFKESSVKLIDKKYKIRSSFNAKLNDRISIFQGDITKLEIDAIVNAANESLLGGGGVDGCIHRAAGPDLLQECRTLNGCKTGDAKITGGYKLPARHVIHTVGPIGENEEKLTSCYETCLKISSEKDLKTVAFPCISTGIYGYPIVDATHVALKAVRNWLERNNNAEKIDRIIFCVFLDKDKYMYEQIAQLYFPLLE
uniref:Macro domain-containing protein n=1 Tax=Romanomermis culicivorax TaxID=13658 RepID=A0A915K0S3_ROMCU